MVQQVSVPVHQDEYGNFCLNALTGVRIDALVVGEVDRPAGPSIPGAVGAQAQVQTLYIKDKDLGGLYLSMTLAQWSEVIGAVSIAPEVWNGGGGDQTLEEVTTLGKTTTKGIDYTDSDGDIRAKIGVIATRTAIGTLSKNNNAGVFLSTNIAGTENAAFFVTDLTGNKVGILSWPSTTLRQINIPDASGTFALTTQSVREVVNTGTNTTYTLSAGVYAMTLMVKPVSNETINIGTTPGGSNLVSARAISAGTYAGNGIPINYYLEASGTIYISGAGGSATYRLLITGLP